METEGDPEYLSFLSSLRECDNSYVFEFQPDGAASSVRVIYDEINPNFEMKTKSKSKSTRSDFSAAEPVIEDYGGEIQSDSVRSGKKRRKDNKILDKDVSASFQKQTQNLARKDVSVDDRERVEIQSQEAATTDFQGFMLLMKMLCPVQKTIYPGWNNNDKEDVIRPMVRLNRPTKTITMDFHWIEEEKEVQARSRHKGNKRGIMESDAEPTFHDFSDSNEEPIMDEIPVEVLSRPPSVYKDRLIRELKRPFDKCEYRELMKKAAFRSTKIVIKELRTVKNAVETKSAGKVRERAIKTEDASNSFFNWYPEVEAKVKRARIGRRLTLLRGFFFWLQNCSWEESFKPWQKGRQGSKVDLRNNSVRPE